MCEHRPGLIRKVLPAFGLFIFAAIASGAPADDRAVEDVLGLRGGGVAAESPVEFTATLVPEGQTGDVALRISAKIPPEHWIYSATPGQGPETKITIKAARGLLETTAQFEADHPPEIVEDPNFEKNVEKYFKKVTWSRHYQLKEGIPAESASIAGLVRYQVCDKQSCRLGKYEFDVKLSAGSAAVADRAPARSADASNSFEQLVGPKGWQTVEGRWSVFLTPRQARPGAEVTVSVQAELNPGWHVYALDQRQLADGSGPVPTVMGLTEPGDLVPLGASFVGPAPVEKSSTAWPGLKERFHEGRIEWTRKYRVPGDVTGGEISLAGKVAWGMCNSGGCQPPIGFEFHGKLTIAEEEILDTAPLAVAGMLRGSKAANAIEELRPDMKNMPNVVRAGAQPDEPPLPAAAPTRGPLAAPPPAEKEQVAEDGGLRAAGEVARAAASIDKSQGLPLFLVAAVLAGFAALLTPCVFPMIPITVSFFQKQSEKEHHRPISMATVYCLGIIGTFTGLGMLMSIAFSAAAIQQLASHWTVNLFIAGVLIFFAFNLLGMFDIQMPSWLLTYTAGQEGRGGFIGVLFMALTFTLTSFTCTFAFAGGLLAAAAQGDRLWPALGLLAFSAAFSLPFFFLALFPSLLQKLPKSGGWMNVAKVIMGLIELGAAFKFFGNVDTTWNGQPEIFDFHLMISAWAVISIAAAIYLLGVFRLPHDMPVDHIGVPRFVVAMSFLGFASYLGVGLFATDKPHGVVWRYVEAFANPNFEAGSDRLGPSLRHGGLDYALDFDRALNAAIAENKPLFLDFTGVTCTNCRYMEKGPMSRPDIQQRLGQFIRVQLYTDSVPIPDKKEAARLLDRNLELQEEWFGDTTLPAYVLISPEPFPLEDRSKIIERLIGKKEDAEFAGFLDRGLSKWQKLAAVRAAKMVGKR
jgi:thiol:disulfide interchange protein DsbD